MKYIEKKGDLFSLSDNEYQFVQCISADFAMGAGIAVQFNKKYNVKNILKGKFTNFLQYWDDPWGRGRGWCLYCNNVYNLITKRNYWHKPDNESMQKALDRLHFLCVKNQVKKLAMPKIGCGLDGMKWHEVSSMI